MKKALMTLGIVCAIFWPGGEKAECQYSARDRRNPIYRTIVVDTAYNMKGIYIAGWYIDSASLAGLLTGQTLVADTSGGRKRLTAGAGAGGSITVVGDATYTGLSQLDLDTANFNTVQTIIGQLQIALKQDLGVWAQPEFGGVYIQDGGGVYMRQSGGLYTVSLIPSASSVSNAVIQLPSISGVLVSSALTPLSISPTGIISFSGIVPITQGGTGASVAPAAGSIIYSNGVNYLGLSGTNGYFPRFAGSGTPTAYNLFGTANTWTAGQTFNAGVGLSNFTMTNLSYTPALGEFVRQNDSLKVGTTTGQRIFEASKIPTTMFSVIIPSGILPSTTVYIPEAGSTDIQHVVVGGYAPIGNIIMIEVGADSMKFSTNGEEVDQTILKVYKRKRE